jgi:hypothetical protein
LSQDSNRQYTDRGVVEVLDDGSQRAGGQAVVGVRDDHDFSVGLGETPVESLRLPQAFRAGQGAGARSLGGRGGLGVTVGDHDDVE